MPFIVLMRNCFAEGMASAAALLRRVLVALGEADASSGALDIETSCAARSSEIVSKPERSRAGSPNRSRRAVTSPGKMHKRRSRRMDSRIHSHIRTKDRRRHRRVRRPCRTPRRPKGAGARGDRPIDDNPIPTHRHATPRIGRPIPIRRLATPTIDRPIPIRLRATPPGVHAIPSHLRAMPSAGRPIPIRRRAKQRHGIRHHGIRRRGSAGQTLRSQTRSSTRVLRGQQSELSACRSPRSVTFTPSRVCLGTS